MSSGNCGFWLDANQHALEESTKLILVMFVENAKFWRVAGHEKRHVSDSGGVVMACVLGEAARSCVSVLKTRHLVAGQAGGLAGRLVAWELLQEPGLLWRHSSSPNTKPQLGTVTRK